MRLRWMAAALVCAVLAGCAARPQPTPAPETSPTPLPTPSATAALTYVDAWVRLAGSMRQLPVRSSPSPDSDVVGAVIDGMRISRAREEDGDWVSVLVEIPSGQYEGYVLWSYLSDSPPEIAARPTPSPEVATDLFNNIGRNTALANPRIVIHKAARRLTLCDGDEPMARFAIALSGASVGSKEKEGDNRTPEGTYYVCSRNDSSKYYKSLGISYPSDLDADRGLATGLITEAQAKEIKTAISRRERPPWDTQLGGQIVIHGGGVSYDWTAGCVALENSAVDVLWAHAPNKTPIEIYP